MPLEGDIVGFGIAEGAGFFHTAACEGFGELERSVRSDSEGEDKDGQLCFLAIDSDEWTHEEERDWLDE